MTLFFYSLLCLIYFFLGRLAFKSWLNHLSVYVFFWYLIVFNYELRLLPFYDLQSEAWFVIFVSINLYGIGALLGRFTFSYPFENILEKVSYYEKFSKKKIKIVKIILISTSILGVIIGTYNWYVLIQKYGSLGEVLIKGNLIYRMRVEGKLSEPVPYIFVVSYTALLLGAFYSAYLNRISFWVVLAFLGVLLKETSTFGRAGILLGVFILLFSFGYSNQFFLKGKAISLKVNKKIILIFVIVIFFSIIGAIVVRGTRGTFENFKGASSSLRYSKDNIFFSPSLYFYFSSHIGVFSQYLKNNELHKTNFGENTFLSLYNVLSKFNIVEKPKNYQIGYFIPYWSNTGTYLREIHEDFGDIGLFLIPFLLGLSVSLFLNKFFYTAKFFYLSLAVYLSSLSALSWITIISRTPQWFLSFIFTVFIVSIFIDSSDKVLSKNQNDS